VDIIGGSFGALHSWDYSHVAMFDGVGSRIWGNDFSTIELYGGTLNSLAGFDDAEITMFVESYTIELNPFLGYDARLTGSWIGNNGNFDILVHDGGLPHINFVPEPSTVAVLALGGLLLRK